METNDRIEKLVQNLMDNPQFQSSDPITVLSLLVSAFTTHEREVVEKEQKRIKKLLSLREASPRTDFDSDEEYQLHRQKIGAINWYANLIKGQIDLPDLPETTY